MGTRGLSRGGVLSFILRYRAGGVRYDCLTASGCACKYCTSGCGRIIVGCSKGVCGYATEAFSSRGSCNLVADRKRLR